MIISNAKREFLFFGLIGILNTLLHSSAVIVSVEFFSINPIIGNIIAFFIANVFSFSMNSKYTFKVSYTWNRYIKFLIASQVSLILTIIFSSLAEYMEWHYLIGLLLVIFIAPLLTFLVQKTFVFNSEIKN